MDNQKGNLYLIIAIIVGVFAIGAIGFASWKYFGGGSELEENGSKIIKPTVEKETEKFNIPIFTNNELDTVINSVLQILNSHSLPIKFLNPVKSSQWWISDDGWSITNPNAVSITSSISTFEKGDYFSPVNPLNPLAKELNDLMSKILSSNGFTLNTLNTSESEERNDFYDYVVAFQKGETRCILKTDGDSGKYNVVCSNRFYEAYEEQIPYLKRYFKTLKLNRDAIISGKKRIGDFVRLSIHFRRTGYFAIMKDNGKEIKLIFAGQEPPPCDLMIENQVPKEVYEVCYDASGNTIE